MGKYTGNRSTGRAKAIGGGILAGLAALGEAAHDGPRLERIREIDQELIDLTREQDFLINELYEPGDLRVRDDFDPSWTPVSKSTSTVRTETAGNGDQVRWIKCEGRDTAGVFHDAHPDCPHLSKIHNEHEFPYKF